MKKKVLLIGGIVLLLSLPLIVLARGYVPIWLGSTNDLSSVGDSPFIPISPPDNLYGYEIEVVRGLPNELQTLVVNGDTVFQGYTIRRITSSYCGRIAFSAFMDGPGGPGLDPGDGLLHASSVWLFNAEGTLKRLSIWHFSGVKR